MRILLFLASVFGCNFILAQNNYLTSPCAQGMGMGNASVALTGIYAGMGNQAGLADLQGVGFALFGQRRFASAALNDVAANVAIPSKAGTFGLAIHHFGFEAFNQQKVGLAYARKLSKGISLGAQADYIGTRFQDNYYGNFSAFTFELGLQAQLSKKLLLGFHAFNPIGSKLVNDERIPTIFRLGLMSRPNDKIALTAELAKDLNNPLSVRGGMEYMPVPVMAIRLGACSQPFMMTVGAGVKLKQIHLDFAASYHQYLGFTPGFSMRGELAKKKK